MSRSLSTTGSARSDFNVSHTSISSSIESNTLPNNIGMSVRVLCEDGIETIIPVSHKVNRSIIRFNFTDKHKLLILIILSVIALLAVGRITFPSISHNFISKSVVIQKTSPSATLNKVFKVPFNPLYLAIPTANLANKINSIITQTGQLIVGGNTVNVSAETIKSWLNITNNIDNSQSFIKVNPELVTSSLMGLANQFVKAPINLVNVNEAGVNTSLMSPVDGDKLADPNSLNSEITSVANNLLGSQGFQLNVPLSTVPAGAASIDSLGKVLVANVNTKRMYAYENGQLVNTFLITAGAPLTPTPIGVFHIWDKLPIQDMSGYNPSGTKYKQPNVQWIDYFDHSGDAVHGNYWRPTSYFGNVNSSHGCLGMTDLDAKWVYDWAPIGTTVITHG